jgi:hypothetical protein
MTREVRAKVAPFREHVAEELLLVRSPTSSGPTVTGAGLLAISILSLAAYVNA